MLLEVAVGTYGIGRKLIKLQALPFTTKWALLLSWLQFGPRIAKGAMFSLWKPGTKLRGDALCVLMDCNTLVTRVPPPNDEATVRAFETEVWAQPLARNGCPQPVLA